MKALMFPLIAIVASLITANQAQAKGGYVFTCSLNWSVENQNYSGLNKTYEFVSSADSEFADSFSKTEGNLKATVQLFEDKITMVTVEDLTTGLVLKGDTSVALYNKKKNQSYSFGCSQKVYRVYNSN